MRRLRGHPEVLRLVRFLVVGAGNTLLTVATYALLLGAGLAAPPASAAGFAVGATNGYVLNRVWTFERAPGGFAVGARYLAVQLLGLALSAGGVWLLVGREHLPRMAGEVVILPLVTATTFLLSRGWVFARPRPARV